MDTPDNCRDMNSHTIKMALVDGTRISACVNIDRGPGYDRLSDLISSDREPFLILINASLLLPDIKTPEQHPTLFINKDHILWAAPENKEA